jgi:hypothetical protein
VVSRIVRGDVRFNQFAPPVNRRVCMAGRFDNLSRRMAESGPMFITCVRLTFPAEKVARRSLW